MIIVVAISEKHVPITDTLNAQPITGRHAIFAKVATATEIKPEIEIVGVYSTLELAAKGRELHAAAHPGRRYVQKVAQLDDLGSPPEPTRCIMCHVETNGLSYCDACRNEHHRQLREADSELLREIAQASK